MRRPRPWACAITARKWPRSGAGIVDAPGAFSLRVRGAKSGRRSAEKAPWKAAAVIGWEKEEMNNKRKEKRRKKSAVNIFTENKIEVRSLDLIVVLVNSLSPKQRKRSAS